MLAEVLYPRVLLEVPKHGRPIWRAATALEPIPPLEMCHFSSQMSASSILFFLANIWGNSVGFFGLLEEVFFVCYLSNPLSEIIVIWICLKKKKHRTFLGLGQSLSSK